MTRPGTSTPDRNDQQRGGEHAPGKQASVDQECGDRHPLLTLLLAAAEGCFPPVDGTVEFLPPLRSGRSVVISFTGHAVLATSLTRQDLAPERLDGYGGALQPAVLMRLAGADGQVGVLDITLVARGRGGDRLPHLDGLDDHPRVQHARALREQVRVHGDERGLITLAHGLAGRTELSIETAPALHGSGAGRTLLNDALTLIPAGAPVFAAVSPGNTRSLRAFLASGFTPVASEILIDPFPSR